MTPEQYRVATEFDRRLVELGIHNDVQLRAALTDLLLAAERAAYERARLLDLFSKRMGMSVATLLEHLPELNAPGPAQLE